jgi:hypothetical protein
MVRSKNGSSTNSRRRHSNLITHDGNYKHLAAAHTIFSYAEFVKHDRHPTGKNGLFSGS